MTNEIDVFFRGTANKPKGGTFAKKKLEQGLQKINVLSEWCGRPHPGRLS